MPNTAAFFDWQFTTDADTNGVFCASGCSGENGDGDHDDDVVNKRRGAGLWPVLLDAALCGLVSCWWSCSLRHQTTFPVFVVVELPSLAGRPMPAWLRVHQEPAALSRYVATDQLTRYYCQRGP